MRPTLSDLTSQECRDLELRYDGPIPPQAVADVIANRGATVRPYVPNGEDLRRQIIFANEMARLEQIQIDRLQTEILDKTAGMEMFAEGSVKDQHRGHIAYLRRQLESAVEAQRPWLEMKADAETKLAGLIVMQKMPPEESAIHNRIIHRISARRYAAQKRAQQAAE